MSSTVRSTFNPTQAGGPTVELPTSASTRATVRPDPMASRAARRARVVLPVSTLPISIATLALETSRAMASWLVSVIEAI